MATVKTAAKKPTIKVTYDGFSAVGPVGRMTRPIVTRYQVGDEVFLTEDLSDDVTPGYLGEAGVVHRIGICEPNDGDETALYFNVKPDDGRVVTAFEYGLAPLEAAEAWLGRHAARLAVHAVTNGRR